MIWLVVYDRAAAKSVLLKEYTDAQRRDAERDRLAEEVAAARSRLDREIVVLEADSLEALRSTHARYFADFERIVQRKLDLR
jgi:hypothetical protein